MKYALLICGPESSGTGNMKNILCQNFKTIYKFGDYIEKNVSYEEDDFNNLFNNSNNYTNVYNLINIENNKKWSFELENKTNKLENEDSYYIKHIGIPFGDFFPNIEYFYKQLVFNGFNVKIITPIRNNEISKISTIRRFKYSEDKANLYKENAKKIINNLLIKNEIDINIFSFDTMIYLKNEYICYFIKKILKLPINIKNYDIKDNIDLKYLK
jgi:hypothetical protein